MHEMGVVLNTVKSVERVAARYGIKNIAYVKMDIGEFSGVAARYVKELWAMGTENTICAGSEVIISEIPGMVECDDCGAMYRLMQNLVKDETPRCPSCGGTKYTVRIGRELMITEVGERE